MLDTVIRIVVIALLLAFAAPKVTPLISVDPQSTFLHGISVQIALWAGLATWQERYSAARVAALLGLVSALILRLAPISISSGWQFALGCASLGALFALAGRACRRTHDLPPFLMSVFSPIFVAIIAAGLELAMPFAPVVYDPVLQRFDMALGGSLSFMLGQWFLRFPWLQWPSVCTYILLPAAMVLALALYSRYPERFRVPLPWLLILGGPLAVALYQVCPALGPVYLFGREFPFGSPVPPALATLEIPDVVRNALPSMHAVWALVLWWNLRLFNKMAGSISTLFLLLTLFATLGTGEHYLVDLLAAAPIAFGWQALWERRWSLGILGFLTGLAVCFEVRLLAAHHIAADAAWATLIGSLFITLSITRGLSRPINVELRATCAPASLASTGVPHPPPRLPQNC